MDTTRYPVVGDRLRGYGHGAGGKAAVSDKPKLLDLFCCQGGAATGYDLAGFEVTGVDIAPMNRYPFRFVLADALEYLAAHWQEYEAFHASPPCQGYSAMKELPWLKDKEYPLLILPTRLMFQEIHELSGKPWVIENVESARWGSKYLEKRGISEHGMQAGFLCGRTLGLPVKRRHRLFETSFLWLAPAHLPHRKATVAVETATVKTRTELKRDGLAAWQRGPSSGARAMGVGVGHAKGWRLAAEAMGVPWMDRYGTTQAIPPVMTAYIGHAMMRALSRKGEG